MILCYLKVALHIANCRAITRKSKNRSITDMLRNERRWNHTKCSLKLQKAEKVEDKNRKQEQKQQTENGNR